MLATQICKKMISEGDIFFSKEKLTFYIYFEILIQNIEFFHSFHKKSSLMTMKPLQNPKLRLRIFVLSKPQLFFIRCSILFCKLIINMVMHIFAKNKQYWQNFKSNVFNIYFSTQSCSSQIICRLRS